MFAIISKVAVFWYLLLIFQFHGPVICGRNILLHEMDRNQPNEIIYEKSANSEFTLNAEKLLHRNKRYLLFTNGGISKVSNPFVYF